MASTGSPAEEVLVCSIPTEASEEVLKAEFAKYGDVVEVQMQRDASGPQKSYACVIYQTRQEATRAVEATSGCLLLPGASAPCEALRKPTMPVGGGYGPFVAKHWAELASATTGQNGAAVHKLAGEKWGKLTATEKEPYVKEFQSRKRRFEQDMTAFQAKKRKAEEPRPVQEDGEVAPAPEPALAGERGDIEVAVPAEAPAEKQPEAEAVAPEQAPVAERREAEAAVPEPAPAEERREADVAMEAAEEPAQEDAEAAPVVAKDVADQGEEAVAKDAVHQEEEEAVEQKHSSQRSAKAAAAEDYEAAMVAGGAKDDDLGDCYELLGVDEEAGDKEIQAAYRKGSLKCHPDRNPDDPEAAQKFDRLTRAKDLLLNPAERAAPDRQRKAKRDLEERFAQDRLSVKLDSTGKSVSIKPENLERLAAASQALVLTLGFAACAMMT